MAFGSSYLNDRPSLAELVEVQQHLRLPAAAVVEKDWYVVRALAAIRSADTGQFRLFFGGGTALSRAHRVVGRMSEDIDLKIVSNQPFARASLRKLRETITKALLAAGFAFDPENPLHRQSANASRYTLYRLPYELLTEPHAALRPEIQVETTMWPLRLPSVELSVTSFVNEAFKRPPEIPSISCVALLETAAEKFVSLTRRVGAELAGAGGPRDPALVRHVYDLHTIRRHYDADQLIALARGIILADVEAYGHQFPAYRDNPIKETIRAVDGMRGNPEFAERYRSFLRGMVYAEAPAFEEALATIAALADRLKSEA